MDYFATISEAVKILSGSTLFNKKVIREAQKSLIQNEKIAAAVTCSVLKNGEKNPGLFVVTDRRVFSICSFMGDRAFQEIMIQDIRDINSSKLNWNFTVYGNIVTIETKFFSWKIIDYSNKAINEMRQLSKAPGAIPHELSQGADYNELKALKELLDSGIITEEEFQAKKKQILNL